MTINVAVKCPEGLVMGTDSLLTVETKRRLENGKLQWASTVLPFHSKLFQLSNLPIGIMICGRVAAKQTSAQDLIAQFSETAEIRILTIENDPYDIENIVDLLVEFLTESVQRLSTIRGLEMFVGGYSRGPRLRRFAELYRLSVTSQQVVKRREFGELEFDFTYSGDVDPIDRYVYGMSRDHIGVLRERRDALFRKTADYVIAQLRRQGISLPSDTKVSRPDPASSFSEWQEYNEVFDTVSLLSEYTMPTNPLERDGSMIAGSVCQYDFPCRFLSLQSTINLCQFLMSCSYVLNNFTVMTPTVGSEMCVATITRETGFTYLQKWQPKCTTTALSY